ncbi:non-canonical purine NTP pyrophosphatase [Patescibacteria group bacterium]
MNLYFITGNKNKFAEASAIISGIKQLNIDLPEIQEIDAKKIIRAKLLEALKHKKGEFIVEDTSLCLDCLNGLPGPLIKWFLETLENQGIYELARIYKNYGAQARTIVGYAKSKNNIRFFEGKLRGRIVKPIHKTSFGWDPIFQPEGHKKNFAQMSREEKNKISMRKKALNKLSKHLMS